MRPLIAGNWKMHGLRADLTEIESIAAMAANLQPDVEILVCPPATLVAEAARIAGGRIAIGGQDCHAEVSGHHTGDISAEMLKDAGASAVIAGHSERRRDHGETNALAAAKAGAARGAARDRLRRRNGIAAGRRGRLVHMRWPNRRERSHGDDRGGPRDRLRTALGDWHG